MPSPESASAEVKEVLHHFLDAFRNLDWSAFMDYFADEASMFFPSTAKSARLARGKKEIESLFRPFFDHLRSQRRSAPYIDIDPLDLEIRLFDELALIMFHLDDPGQYGRRTIIMRRSNRVWKIFHVHASAFPGKPE